MVEALLVDGWRVATFSRAPSEETSRLQDRYAERFHWDAIDASQSQSLRAFVATVRERWERLDALVNNAAIAREGMFTLQSEQDIEQSLAVNLAGVLHLTRACAQAMLVNGGGAIVNVSSLMPFAAMQESRSTVRPKRLSMALRAVWRVSWDRVEFGSIPWHPDILPVTDCRNERTTASAHCASHAARTLG